MYEEAPYGWSMLKNLLMPVTQITERLKKLRRRLNYGRFSSDVYSVWVKVLIDHFNLNSHMLLSCREYWRVNNRQY